MVTALILMKIERNRINAVAEAEMEAIELGGEV